MIRFLVHWLSVAVALALVAWLMPGIRIDSPLALGIGSLVLGLVNALVRPLLFWLTFPLTLLTLGLFYLVVNALAFGLAAWLVHGFSVDSGVAAIVGALLVSLTSGLVEGLLQDR